MNLPKLWKEIEKTKNEGVNINYAYKGKSPGSARGANTIVLNPKYLFAISEEYPEDRLIIVLLHEYGHLLYFRETSKTDRNRINSEYAAFKHSVEVSIEKSNNGDCRPLELVVKNLKIRSQNGNPQDPHTIAINRLIKSNTWKLARSQIKKSRKLKCK